MATPWTPPKDWVDGETPTGSQFNTHIRDNLKHLKEVQDVPVTDISVSGDVSVGDDLGVSGDASVVGGLTVGALGVTGNAFITGELTVGVVHNAQLVNYVETYTTPTISGGVLTIDLTLGTYFVVILNANCSVTLVNPPTTGRAVAITIHFIGDGTVRTVTWPGTSWPGGFAPVMSGTVSKRDIISLINWGGTGWYGVIVGQNY